MRIGIFGATGLVGKELLKLLDNNHLNVKFNNLKLFASESSIGKIINFRGENLIVESYNNETFSQLEILILCTSANVSKEIIKLAKDYNCLIIDNSSAFRFDKHVPLVVPEINGHLIKGNNIIANPNCCTALLTMVLHPLHLKYNINKVIVSTYQSASGAGQNGLDELILNPTESYPVFGRQYLYNVFSHNSEIDLESLYNDEEVKIMLETKKILNADIKISATCVRVPTIRAHAESVHIEFKNKVELNEIRSVLNNQFGVIVEDNINSGEFPEPIKVENKFDVMVGRIRYDISDESKKSINLFLCGDQLLKGAALNAYQILDYSSQSDQFISQYL